MLKPRVSDGAPKLSIPEKNPSYEYAASLEMHGWFVNAYAIKL